jgi:type 1 glutamine amidotransferase
VAQLALVLGGLTERFHQFWILGPAVRGILAEHGLQALLSEDLEVLASPGLGRYDLLVNLTTGRTLEPAQEEGLLAFVRSGRGLVGIHNAADTFKNSPAYLDLLGGRFVTHPPQLDIAVEYTAPEHPVVSGLPPFTVRDELYILDWRPERVELLAQTRSHEGRPVPLCWVRREGAGRVFYLSLGHNPSTYEHPVFRAWLGRGARWAAGLNPLPAA